VLSRAIGLAREITVALLWGTTATADRLVTAFVVASVAGIVVGEAIYTGSVLWMSAGRRVADSLDQRHRRLLKVGLWAAVASTALFLLVGPIVTIAVVGWSEAEQSAALAMALAPSLGATVFSACQNARLTIDGRITLINAVTALYSLGAVTPALILVMMDMDVPPIAVAFGWSAGNIAASVVLFVSSRPKAAVAVPRSELDWAIVLRSIFALGAIASLAYSVTPLQALTARFVAARLDTGDVAAFSYADRLFLIPIGFVVAALGPLVLGTLARDRIPVTDKAVRRLWLFVATLLPISFLFLALGPLAVRGLFEFAEFGPTSTDKTVAALDGLTIGIPAVAVTIVFFRAMQATAKPRVIAYVCGMAIVVNVALNIAGAFTLGLFGVALGLSLAAYAVMHAQSVYVMQALRASWISDFLGKVAAPIGLAMLISLLIVGLDRANVIGTPVRAGFFVVLAALAAGGAVRAASRRSAT
jgi:putative peptidoglycan lipid II flippase